LDAAHTLEDALNDVEAMAGFGYFIYLGRGCSVLPWMRDDEAWSVIDDSKNKTASIELELTIDNV